jgi:hypothetical protein
MSADGVKKFIAAVDLIYPAPQYDGDKMRQGAWLSLMVQTLGGCSDEVLAAASAHILRKRDPKKDGRFFPTLNECIKITHEVAEEVERAKVALIEHKTPEVSYERRIALARDLMQSPMGQKANKEGWGTVMFNFCVEHMKAPQGQEIEDCKRSAREFEATRERCAKGDHPLAKTWTKYAEDMVAKLRERMGEKVA